MEGCEEEIVIVVVVVVLLCHTRRGKGRKEDDDIGPATIPSRYVIVPQATTQHATRTVHATVGFIVVVLPLLVLPIVASSQYWYNPF